MELFQYFPKNTRILFLQISFATSMFSCLFKSRWNETHSWMFTRANVWTEQTQEVFVCCCMHSWAKKSGLWFINTPWISHVKRYYVNRIISVIALQCSKSHYLLILNKGMYLEKPKTIRFKSSAFFFALCHCRASPWALQESSSLLWGAWNPAWSSCYSVLKVVIFPVATCWQ